MIQHRSRGGNINKPFYNKAAVYIYMCNLESPSNPRYYVGSTSNLKKRTSSHRYYTLNWNKYKDSSRICPIFYRSVSKYGWSIFKFGILEYVDLPSEIVIEQRKKIILEKEQYYLGNINPSLNVSKIAGSRLGAKHSPETILKLKDIYLITKKLII